MISNYVCWSYVSSVSPDYIVNKVTVTTVTPCHSTFVITDGTYLSLAEKTNNLEKFLLGIQSVFT